MEPERVKSMVWCAVAASAVGLRFRSRSLDELSELTPADMGEPGDAPNGRYPPRAWSALLEPFFVAAEAAAAAAAAPEDSEVEKASFVLQFAERYRSWSAHGFPGWEGATPYDRDAHSHAVCTAKGYAADPLRVALATPMLPNDEAPLVRALLAATLPDDRAAAAAGEALARCTHSGASPVAATVFVAIVLQSQLYGAQPDAQNAAYAAQAAATAAGPGAQLAPLFAALTDRHLTVTPGLGNHLTALRCFFWAYRRLAGKAAAPPLPAEPREAFAALLLDVCRLGGSADFNCALVGALVGAHYGARAVPLWTARLHRVAWVKEQIEALLQLNASGMRSSA